MPDNFYFYAISIMKGIKNTELLYPNWQPSHIAFIKSLHWSLGSLVLTCYCQSPEGLAGWPDMSGMFTEVIFNFHHVSDLDIKSLGNGPAQIMGFDIENMSDSGLEHTNFRITDYENGKLSFYCEEIVVEDVATPSMLEWQWN